MSGAGFWAASIRRRRRSGAAAMAIFAGAAAGLVMAAVGIAGRTSNAIDRYLDQPTLAGTVVIACPPGVEPSSAEEFEACFDTANAIKVTEELSRSPNVAAAVPLATLVSGVRVSGSTDWQPTIHQAQLGDWPGLISAPVVVAGRIPRNDSATEVALNEQLASELGVHVGDHIDVATFAASERTDAVSDDLAVPSGAVAKMRVTAVVRSIADLPESAEPTLLTTAGWWRAMGTDDAAGYGRGAAIQIAPHSPGIPDLLSNALPDRAFDFQAQDEAVRSTNGIISLQASAAWIVAAIACAASLGFVGQALARQCQRDLADRRTAAALGMTRIDVAWSALLATAPIALAASCVAAIVAVAASPIGPIGEARRIEIDPGFRVDAGRLALGAVSVFVLMLLGTAVSSWLILRSRRRTPLPLVGSPPPLPLSPRVGLSFLRRHDGTSIGGAMVGCAAALAMIVVALSVGQSYVSLKAEPSRFGQTWDVTLGDFADQGELDIGLAAVRATDGVRGVGLVQTYTASIAGDDTLVVRFAMSDNAVGPAIIDGRAPRSGEVALGINTLAALGLRLGDETTIATNAGSTIGPLRVVGTVAINDGVEDTLAIGRGAIVNQSDFPSQFNEGVGQSLLIKPVDGVTPDELVDRLKTNFGGSVKVATPPADISNLGRISEAPALLAAIVGALALVTLAGSVSAVLRRRRRDIGILRTIGFDSRQVTAASLSVPLTLTSAAVVVGLPVGLVAARWIWSIVQQRLGLRSPLDVPIGSIALSCIAILTAGVMVALVPTVRGLRRNDAAALRSE